ncbi:exosortase W [Desulfatitalea alkaliphila]|uniref:Exosortase W n=1 Tax=Desulfatitalea alkaliphila TaxID=2929485 RepID=A0AA41R4D2_9BACT|nr:exosortase W [Desulfatitalea alkaliphila]MCJ8502104.1 exosortase W [Desulfatitalea alkaliphila]
MNFKKMLLTAVLAGAFISLYYDALQHLIAKTLTTDGSHAPLILAVSLYLIWLKRQELRTLPAQPALLPGTLLIVFSGLVLYAGKISSTMLIQVVSMVPMILGYIWLLLGYGFLKTLLVPVGYLIFLSGLIEYGLGSVADQLQQISAWIAVKLLALTGMPVFHRGIMIELPHISLEVARACSGISHIISLAALSVPLAYLTQRTTARKALVVIASLVIGILANGLRIALIGIYALYNPDAELHGPYETLYVSFIFFFGMIVLVIFNQVLRKLDGKKNEAREQLNGGDALDDRRISSPAKQSLNGSTPKYKTPALVASTLFVLTLGITHLYTPQQVPLKTPLAELPVYISGFTGTALDQFDERLRPFAADQELMRRYRDNDGSSVELYIGYFESQGRDRKIIDGRRYWMHLEAEKVEISKHRPSFFINRSQLRDDQPPSTVYHWYYIDGRIVTNELAGKIITFWSGFAKRKTNGAVVVLRTHNDSSQIKAVIEEMVSMIEARLPLLISGKQI